MLGLILVFFVGRAFYNLAKEFNKTPWLYVIIGIGSYYLGIIIYSLAVGLLVGIFNPDLLEGSFSIVIGLTAIPFGVLACYLYYSMLKKDWSKRPKSSVELDQYVSKFGQKVEDRNFE